MDSLVAELPDLYRVAVNAPIETFSDEVLKRLHRWIDFDGAVFGSGIAPVQGVQITSVCVDRRDPHILADYALITEDDPVTASLMREPSLAHAVDTRQAYAGKPYAAMRRFAARHELRHLLFVGDPKRADAAVRWVVLYHGTDRPFDAQIGTRLWAVWQHISCAIDMNRARGLDREEAQRPERALALVDASGAFEAVDPAFRELLASEWPHDDGVRLPAPVRRAMAIADRCVGRIVDIGFRRIGTRVLCRARRRDAVVLSPRQQMVADCFAQGCSHKEVARRLGVSPHTVRCQLAEVYRKLGVHDKTALARRLAAAVPPDAQRH